MSDTLDQTFHFLISINLYVFSRTVLACAVLAAILSLLLYVVRWRMRQSHAIDYRDAVIARRLEKDLLIIRRILPHALILLVITSIGVFLLSAMN